MKRSCPLILFMILALSGCGGDESSGGTTTLPATVIELSTLEAGVSLSTIQVAATGGTTPYSYSLVEDVSVTGTTIDQDGYIDIPDYGPDVTYVMVEVTDAKGATKTFRISLLGEPSPWYKASTVEPAEIIAADMVIQWLDEASPSVDTVASGCGSDECPALIDNTAGMNLLPSLLFDGANDNMVFPNTIDPGTIGDFTISVIFSTSDSGVELTTNWDEGFGLIDSTAISGTPAIGDFGISYDRNNGKIHAGIHDGAIQNIVSTDFIGDSSGHHLIFTREASSGEIELWIDGIQQGITVAGTVGNFPGNANIMIGSLLDGTNLFTGNIAEVIIYNRWMGGLANSERMELEVYSRTRYSLDNYPVVSGITINGGAALTNNENVSIGISYVEANPYQVCVREDTNFAACSWDTFANPYNYTITGIDGPVPLYVWMKNLSGNMTPSDEYALNTITLDRIDPTIPSVDDAASFVMLTNVTWTWSASTDAVSGIQTYNVKACTDIACTAGCVAGTNTAGLSQNIAGLTNGITYYGCVQAVDNSSNISGFGSSSNATTIDTTNPTQPAVDDAAIFSSASSVIWTWSASTDATAGIQTYNVKACTNTACTTACVAGADTTGLTQTVSGLSNDIYYGCVQAVDNAGNVSGYKNSVGSTTVDVANPTQPGVVNNAGSYSTSTDVGWTWTVGTDGGSGIDYYNVKACTDTGCSTGCVAGANTAGLAQVITSLTNGSSYYGCVQTVDNAGNLSGYKNSSASTLIDTTNPIMPGTVNSAATYSSANSVSWSWTAGSDGISGIQTYNVKACTDSACTTDCIVGPSGSSPQIIAGLVDGNSYYGCARTVDNAGNTSAYNNSASATMVDTTNPTQPAVDDALAISAVNSIAWTWSASTDGSSGIQTYNVKACTDTACTTSCVAGADTTGLTQTVSGLADSVYYGCIQAVDNAGNVSGFKNTSASSRVDTTNPTWPAAVNNGVTYSSATSVVWTWTAGSDGGSGIQTYNVKACSDTACTTSCVAAADTTGLTQTISGLTNNVSYYGCVQTVDNAAHVSGYKNSAATTLIDTIDPNMPGTVNSAATYSTTNSVNWSWTAGSDGGSGIQTYNVKACTDIACTTACVVGSDTTGLNQTISSLVNGSSYYGCTQTVDNAGNVSGYEVSATTTIIDTTAPVGPGVNDSAALTTLTSIAWTWTAGSDSISGVQTYNVKACTDTACTTGCVAAADTTGLTQTVTALPDAAYYGCIQTVDNAGNVSGYERSNNTSRVDTTNPLQAGTVNNAITYSASTAVNWTWTVGSDSGSGIQTYNVKACTDVACTTACVVGADTTGLNQTISGLINNTSYYGCVQTVDNVDYVSGYKRSSAATLIDTTDPTLPVTVNDAGTYSTTNFISWSWSVGSDTISGVQTYNVKACTDSGCSAGCIAGPDGASPQTVSSLVNGNSYYGCIQTVDNAGNTSGYEVSSSSTLVDTTNPTGPGVNDSVVLTTLTSVAWTWSAGFDGISGIETYNVKACTNTSCTTGCVAASDTTGLTQTVSALPDAAYYGCIQTLDKAGNVSGFARSTNTSRVDTTDPIQPGTVNNATAYSSSTSVTWTWSVGFDSGSGIQTYNVKACTDTACSAGCVAGSDTTGLSQTINGLSNTVSYYGCIQTKDNVDFVSGYKNSSSSTYIDTVNPVEPPTVNDATLQAHSLTWTWLAGSDTESGVQIYNIKACTDSACTANCVTGTSTAALTQAVFNFVEATAYYGCIRTVDMSNRVSAYVSSANPTTFFDTGDPDQPGTVNNGVTYSAITSVTWSWTVGFDNGSGIQTYNTKACTNTACTTSCIAGANTTSLSQSISGLSNATSYYGCIQAVDNGNNVSGYKNSVASTLIDTTNPAIPASVGSAATYSAADSVIWSWTAGSDGISGVQTYNVKACTDSGCTTACVAAANTPGVSQTVSSLVNGSSYYGCIQTVDNAGNVSGYDSSATSTLVDTTDPTGPAVDDSLVYTDSTSVAWTWSAGFDGISGIQTYNVKACTDAACTISCVAAADTTGLSQTVSGLADGIYYGCVQTVDNIDNVSGYNSSSSTTQVDTVNPTWPATVNNGVTYSSATSVVWTWTAGSDGGSGIQTYNVKACTDAACTAGCILGTDTTGLTQTMSGLTNNVSYYGCVQTVDNADHVSGYKNSIATTLIDTTDPNMPGTVNSAATYSTINSVNWSWTAGSDGGSGIQTYNVKACTDISCTTACVAGSDTTGLNQTVSSLVNGSSYYGCTQTVDNAGNVSGYEVSATSTLVDTSAPTLPAVNNGVAISTVNDVAWTWSASSDGASGIQTYNVKACTNTACTTACVAGADTTGLTQIVSGLADGVYYGCIQAVDNANNISGYDYSTASTLVDTTNPAQAGVVNNLGTYSTVTSLLWTWTAGSDGGSGIQTYNVKACTNSACSTDCIAGTDTSGLSQTISGLVTASSYYGCVQTVDNGGNLSGYKSTTMSTYIDDVNPTQPMVNDGVAGANSATWTWLAGLDGQSGIQTYNVKACTDAACSTACTDGDDTSGLSQVVSGLTSASSYYGCAQTVDNAGNVSGFSSSVGSTLIP